MYSNEYSCRKTLGIGTWKTRTSVCLSMNFFENTLGIGRVFLLCCVCVTTPERSASELAKLPVQNHLLQDHIALTLRRDCILSDIEEKGTTIALLSPRTVRESCYLNTEQTKWFGNNVPYTFGRLESLSKIFSHRINISLCACTTEMCTWSAPTLFRCQLFSFSFVSSCGFGPKSVPFLPKGRSCANTHQKNEPPIHIFVRSEAHQQRPTTSIAKVKIQIHNSTYPLAALLVLPVSSLPL